MKHLARVGAHDLRMNLRYLLLLSLVSCSYARSSPTAAARLVTRGAELRCQAASLTGLDHELEQTARELGGYVVRSERLESALDVELRVPTEKLDLALDALAAHGQHVDSREVRGEDITEEYVDKEGQLRNLTATRERLIALLDRADRVEDALAVNRGLSDVQGEIEKLEGRVKFLERSAAMSRVHASFYPAGGAAEWRPAEVAREAAIVLLAVARLMVNVVIVLVVFFPVWAPIVFFARRRVKQLRPG